MEQLRQIRVMLPATSYMKKQVKLPRAGGQIPVIFE
jgi:hypothetical protein